MGGSWPETTGGHESGPLSCPVVGSLVLNLEEAALL
jgi:hypothetical protein